MLIEHINARLPYPAEILILVLVNGFRKLHEYCEHQLGYTPAMHPVFASREGPMPDSQNKP